MFQLPETDTDIDDIRTWVKYRCRLCQHCRASCCTLPVEVKAADLIRMKLMDRCELEDNPKTIARRLKKEGVVEHFHYKSATYTLTRMANGDCIYLDKKTRLCTIYALRPNTCRRHPEVGPRPGFCAFRLKQ